MSRTIRNTPFDSDNDDKFAKKYQKEYHKKQNRKINQELKKYQKFV